MRPRFKTKICMSEPCRAGLGDGGLPSPDDSTSLELFLPARLLRFRTGGFLW